MYTKKHEFNDRLYAIERWIKQHDCAHDGSLTFVTWDALGSNYPYYVKCDKCGDIIYRTTSIEEILKRKKEYYTKQADSINALLKNQRED